MFGWLKEGSTPKASLWFYPCSKKTQTLERLFSFTCIIIYFFSTVWSSSTCVTLFNCLHTFSFPQLIFCQCDKLSSLWTAEHHENWCFSALSNNVFYALFFGSCHFANTVRTWLLSNKNILQGSCYNLLKKKKKKKVDAYKDLLFAQPWAFPKHGSLQIICCCSLVKNFFSSRRYEEHISVDLNSVLTRGSCSCFLTFMLTKVKNSMFSNL